MVRKLKEFKCINCGKTAKNRSKEPKFCSKRCWGQYISIKNWSNNGFRVKHRTAMQTVYNSEEVKRKLRKAILQQYETGDRDPNVTTEAAHKKIRELLKSNKWRRENSLSVAKGRQDNRKLFPEKASKWEKIMRAHLYAHNKSFVEEFSFDVFNIDFAYTNEKIAIEINSGGWHSLPNKRAFDIRKEKLLKENNWKLYINSCPFCDFKLDFNKLYNFKLYDLKCKECESDFKHRDKRQIKCDLCNHNTKPS